MKINWGILATGAIARALADALPDSRTGVLKAVASRSQSKAEEFAAKYVDVRAHGSYQALIDDEDVDAIYIATPHPQHLEWAIKAARARKHILVEKPIGLNFAEASLIFDAANAAGVLAMEAFMYRCHPATAALVELIRERAIGDVRAIHATFSFAAKFNPDSRVYNNDLAGGAILDVGCYTASISRLVAGVAIGKDFDDPISISGNAQLAPTGVDEVAAAVLKFKSGIIAQLSTAVAINQDNGLRIYGTGGKIEFPNCYPHARKPPQECVILVHRDGEAVQEIDLTTDVTSYTFQADAFGEAVLAARDSGEQPRVAAPAPTPEDTLGNMRVIDEWRNAGGFVLNQEKPANFRKTSHDGAPLRMKDDAPMTYGNIDGVSQKISRLIMGVDNQRTFPAAAAVFDHYFELGGNTFDTAWIYANGMQESLLGDWMKLRGVRDQVVVISKGCHPPFAKPEHVASQVQQSLERLKIDRADIYMLHRDNPQVPAGEWIDALDEQHRAGRIGIFGGSNWTISRMDEANAYAAKHSRQPMRVLSNQFSLARMVEAPWRGCLSASDSESRHWLTRTKTPLLSWSSQARGFFLPGNASPQNREDAELARCWYSDDNFQRLERANQLAKELGVEAIHISLAYALHQPFPMFTLIGPRNVLETRSSLRALEVKLTDQQVKWLNLEG